MSPALLDSRAPAHTLYVHHEGHSLQNPNPNGQVSSLSSVNFTGLSSINSSMTMNSSNANTEPSGFQNSKEITSDIGLNKPGLGSGKPAFGSALGRSKPRMVKLSRHSASNYPRSTRSPETGYVDPGFNPFRTISDNSIPSFSRAEKGSPVPENMNFGNVGNEAFVFGASGEKSSTKLNSRIANSSGFVANEILDDMRKLKIVNQHELVNTSNPALNLNMSDKGSSLNMSDIECSSRVEDSDKGVPVFGSVHKKSAESKLPDEMRELNIEGSRNAESSKNVKYVNSNLSAHNKTHLSSGSADNVANSFGTSVASELPNELKKLNIKDAGEVDGSSISFNADDMKKFVYGDINKGSSSLAGISASTLPDKMKNLNMKDSVNTYGGEKKEVNFSASDKRGFVFGSTGGTFGSLDGRAEDMLLDEMGKLKIAKEGGDNTGQRLTSFGSSTLFMKETHGNLGDKKFQDFRSSIPAEFAFQAGLQGQCSSSIQVNHDNCNDYTKLHGTNASSSTFLSSDVHFQAVGNVIEVPSMDRPEKNDEFNFSSSWDGTGTTHAEFTTPNQKGNIFTGLDKKPEFSAKRESAKDARSKKKRGKMRKPTSVQQWLGQDFVSRKSRSQERSDSFESYSPMDVSPYEEILDHNKGSTETSVASEEVFHLSISNTSNESCPTVSNDAIDEDLVVATQRLDINEGDVKCAETEVEDSQYGFGKGVGAVDPSEEPVLGPQTESFKSSAEQLDCSTDTFVTAADTEVSCSPRIERQDSDGRMQFSFASALEDVGGTSFMFAASSSAQSQSSAAIRPYKKKNHAKVVHDSYSSTPNTKAPHTSSSMQFFPLAEPSSLLSPRRGQRGDLPTSFSKRGDKSKAVKEQETKQEAVSTPAASIAAQESCEKWRLRGNQAYANGDMSRAEEYYTQGVNCVSQNENSRSCLRSLMLCYSNRAATRISLGRMRAAIVDCMRAAAIDPNFLRVQVRAANCYLALGEVEDASLHFIKCLQSGSDACVDRKLVLEASEGLEKAQKVLECMKQSTELLRRRTSSDAQSALGVIAEALTISSYCEKLLEMKADALFMLRKYEEVIQLCEQTLGSAEMNCTAISADGHSTNLDCSVFRIETSVRLWRWPLIIKSYFCLGRLEEALDFLKKQEKSISTTEESESKTLESLIPLASTIRELLRHKAAGNEAFQSGRHAEAVEHYTAALSCTVESRPFAAVCLCNRATAYKAMGQIIDAIADCSLAIALDRNYLKAISRRATLFEMIRDYEQATRDLQRLVSLLMKQVEDKANQSGASDRTSSVNELRQAQQWLSSIEQEARKEIPLNMYLILGVDPSVMASEIKKAYRKAALRHHPDKAGQSLARSENGDDGLRKEVVEEVHKDADRIFKMIGEAYAVLSDPTKRSRYDLEEEMRNAQKRGTGGSTSRMHTDFQNYPFEKSSSRRQWQEVWRSYGNSQSRGSETTRSSRYS